MGAIAIRVIASAQLLDELRNRQPLRTSYSPLFSFITPGKFTEDCYNGFVNGLDMTQGAKPWWLHAVVPHTNRVPFLAAILSVF